MTFKSTSTGLLAGALGLAITLGACSGEESKKKGSDLPPTGAGGDSNSPGVPELPESCEASAPGTRLLRRLTQQELENTHTDVFPGVAPTTTLPGDSFDRVRLSNDASTLVMGTNMTQAMLDRAEEIAGAVTEPTALAGTLPCAATTPDEACATEFINAYGQRLFRRPLAAEDTERYLGLFRTVSSQSSFETGLKWTLVAQIQSPHTVYRGELGAGDGKLTPYEVASELSYNFSAGPPSDELVALALDGSLEDPEVRFQEAKKLLMTPRGKEVVQQFFREWLGYEDVLSVARSNTQKEFEPVRQKMVEETRRFVDLLVYEKQGKLADLMTANFTVADEELSTYYGFPGGTGDILAGGGAEIPRGHGLGIFAQGSVLTTMASITITSPTRRGLLLLRRLYCEVPGLPEAVNFDLTDDSVTGNTTRERLESSHLAPACQSCHKDFDPLGFAFENYDHTGLFRTEEATPAGSFPVDASATVAKLGGTEVVGQEPLMQGLAGDPAVLSCVSSTMTRYVYGSSGTCRDKDARIRVMNGETSILDYIADLAREPHFVQRQP